MSAGRPPAGRRGRRLRVALSVLAAVLVLLEVGLRVLGVDPAVAPLRYRFAGRLDAEPDFFRPDPELFWDLRPGGIEPAGGDRIGARGLRGSEVADLPAPGTTRIALLGDSCTYGVGVPYPDTWAGRLAGELGTRRPDLAVEIVNGGVPGYSFWQGLRFFERRIRGLHPSVVVLEHGAWNDYNPAMEGDDRAISARGYAKVVGLERVHELLQQSRLYCWAIAHLSDGIRWHDWRSTVDEWLDGEPSGGYRVDPVTFEELLERFVAECAEDGARPVFVLWCLNRDFPDPRQARNFERSERYRQILARVAARHELPTLDLREVFAGAPDAELFQDLMHPSAAGHARLAAGMADFLAQVLPR